MIGLVGLALADPVALRTPEDGPAATLGRHDVSLAVPLGEGPWVAAELASNAASIGASVGHRVVLSASGTRRLQGGVAGGLSVPLVQPGLAITGTAWLHGGWLGERASFLAGAAVPLALGTGGVRLPVLLELQGGVRIGRVSVGGRLAAGPVYTPGTDVSTFLEPALFIQSARR